MTTSAARLPTISPIVLDASAKTFVDALRKPLNTSGHVGMAEVRDINAGLVSRESVVADGRRVRTNLEQIVDGAPFTWRGRTMQVTWHDRVDDDGDKTRVATVNGLSDDAFVRFIEFIRGLFGRSELESHAKEINQLVANLPRRPTLSELERNAALSARLAEQSAQNKDPNAAMHQRWAQQCAILLQTAKNGEVV